MNNDHSSFHLTPSQPSVHNKKWWQFRKMDRKEYGRTFWICILGGYIIKGVIGDALVVVGLISGIFWLTHLIKERSKKKI